MSATEAAAYARGVRDVLALARQAADAIEELVQPVPADFLQKQASATTTDIALTRSRTL